MKNRHTSIIPNIMFLHSCMLNDDFSWHNEIVETLSLDLFNPLPRPNLPRSKPRPHGSLS